MKRITIVWTIALLILIAAIGYPVLAAPVEVSNPQVFTLNSTGIAASQNFAGIGPMGQHEQMQIFMFVDQGTVNTTTLVLQVSPDNETFVNHSTGSALLTNNAADADSYKSVAVEGLYYRIAATLANTNTVTPTIKVVLR